MSDNNNFNSYNPEDFDKDDFESLRRRIEALKAKEDHEGIAELLSKYDWNFADGSKAKEFLESIAWQDNLMTNKPDMLSRDERFNAVYTNFKDTIIRNLPDIDPTIAKNLVEASIEEILPLVFKASEEIKHRYIDTGKFEGFEHPEIKHIIEKHLLSSHRSQQGWFTKVMRKVGTPIHEIWGQQKTAEGEPAIVAKNVHTAISRAGNVVAGGLFIEGMLAITHPALAVTSSVLLYTGLQSLNEYTNEVEHSTVDKRNPVKKLTKWTTILAAKAVPIIMTALSAAAVDTPRLHERYLTNEGVRLHEQVTKQIKDAQNTGSIKNLQDKLDKLDTEIGRYKKQLNEPFGSVKRTNAYLALKGKAWNRDNTGEGQIIKDQRDIQKQLDDKKAVIDKFEDDWKNLGPIGFLNNHSDQFYGGDKILTQKYQERIKDYEKLSAGTRFENGIGHMKDALFSTKTDAKGNETWNPKFDDEILLRVWIAMLFESLSIITLVAVQSRADFRKVITNSDAQTSLGQVVEGAVALNRQVAAIGDFNEFRSQEDMLLTKPQDGSNDHKKKEVDENGEPIDEPNTVQDSKATNTPKIPKNDVSFRFNADLEKSILQSNSPAESDINQNEFLLAKNLNSAQKLWRHFVTKPIHRFTDDKHDRKEWRHEPPSYSSLIKSVAIQKAIAELFREGHVPAFNQIVGDLSRGLIHPIPFDTEAIDRYDKAKKDKLSAKTGELAEGMVAESKHDEKLEGDVRHLGNMPRNMIRSIERDILSNARNYLTTEDLAFNLSRILENETPAKDENNEKLLELLGEKGRKEAYQALLKRLKDLNSDAQDVINNYGASKDRLDLKNMFRDQLRDAIKRFTDNEGYNEQITEKPLTNLVQGLETQESNSNLNYIRMDTAIAYLKGLVSKDSLSPVFLNDMIESLKTGDAVIISKKKGEAEIIEKIKELHLASPYEPSVELAIFKMQNLATEYMTLRRNWFIQDKKLTEFKNTLGTIMLRYEKESREEKMKLKGLDPDSPRPENKKSKFDEILDEE